jgi:kumamolisin
MLKSASHRLILAGVALAALAAGHAQASAPVPAVARRDVADLGRAPSDMQVRVLILLAYRDRPGLEALVTAQATPGSPLYHHFLTPEMFTARFAATEEAAGRVLDSLRRAGFASAELSSNRTLIEATGSAAVASAYFRTDIHMVAQRGHGTRYANLTPGVVPEEIAGDVGALLGLDNLVKFHVHNRKAAISRPDFQHSDTPRAAPASAPIERTVGGSFAGIYPAGLAAAYHYPSLSGDAGKGHAIGIVIDSDIANSDLATFWSAAGITRTGSFKRVLVDGKNPGINADVGETAIDTEMTSSLAPAANIYVYLVSSLGDADIEKAYNMAVTAKNLDVLSSSFGGCELDDTPFATATDAIAAQGAAIGLTFTASSGDSGGYCNNGAGLETDIVSTPAADPHFVAVGGTTLKINATTGARLAETAWGPGGNNGGGGGGVSSFFAVPSYQSGITGIAVVPTIKATPQPKSGFAGRNVPDISLDASNGGSSYVAIYGTPDGGWTGYGGTSVSSPCFAALLAERNQLLGSKSGYYNPTLYSNYTSNGANPGGTYNKTEFHDITGGSIGAGWKAKTGFDQATGIGSFWNASFQ